METTSLFDRIQSKKDNVNVAPRLNNISDAEYDSSSTDIDDDITLEECATRINNRKNNEQNVAFTKVRLKPILSNLTDILTQKTENEKVLKLQKSPTSQFKNQFLNVVGDDKLTVEAAKNDAIHNTFQSNNTLTNTTSIHNDILNDSLKVSSQPFNSKNTEINKLPVKRKRIKMTLEERQVVKAQKEKEKAERQKQREAQKLERAMEKDFEKAKKKATTLNSRSERKDECMECILAVVDNHLIEDSGADILKALQDAGIQYEMKNLPVPSCIGWMRENISYDVDSNSMITKSSKYVEEDHVLYKMSANELAILVNTQINVTKHEEKEEATFSNLITQLQKAYKNKKITILITGINAYYRFVKTKENQEFRKQALGVEPSKGRKKKTDNVPQLTKKQIDDIISHVQITTNMHVRFCEDLAAVLLFLVSFTKALAEAPFKKLNEASLGFCSVAPSDKASVKIGNDGHGVLEVWNQQLQQFHGVRHDTAVAITQVYPTPLSLMLTYEDLSVPDGIKLLQNIEVRRGVGVFQTQRRVGPELSKKIHKLLTSRNGDEPLAK